MKLIPLLFLLLLTGCAQGPTLPIPPTATARAVGQVTPSATGTGGSQSRPDTPTATPSSTMTPSPTLTPTPTLPEMQVYTGDDEVLRIRLPAAWKAEAEQDATRLDVTFSSPDGRSLFLITIAPAATREAAIERFIESFFGNQPPDTREPLPDGTERLTGLTSNGRRFEMRIRYQVGLLTGLIAAAESEAWEENSRIWEEAFASFHLFPSNAARLLTLPQTPTFDSGALAIRSLNHYYTDSGVLWVVGELANEGEIDAEGVRVAVTLLTADGSEVAMREGYLDQELLLAGEEAPFLLLIENPPAEGSWVALDSEIQGDLATLALARAHKGLIVESVAGAPPTPDGYRLTGEVKNEGDSPASFVRVSGALYNAAGELIATTSIYAPSDSLAPGAAAPFDLKFNDFAGDIADVTNHRVWVTGNK